MLDGSDPDAAFGPIFGVDSVQDFHTGRPSELQISAEPETIPRASGIEHKAVGPIRIRRRPARIRRDR